MRKIFKVFAALLVLIVLVGAVMLAPAHFQIRGIKPDLPGLTEVLQLRSAEHGPVRISAIETALQPSKNGVSGNPVFVIEWEDGRIFMVDAGMDKAAAVDFAEQMELLGATGPLDYRTSAAQALSGKIENIRGMGFTHLHIDHTQGVKDFCERRGAGAKIYQTNAQATLHNLHTEEGAKLLRDSCFEPVVVEREGIVQLKEFPGLAMLHVGGHTPGSTIFFVTIAGKLWVLSGDISNNKQKLLDNKGKGFLYSYLLVPENTRQLGKLRTWLASLDAQDAVEVIVSHDADALAKSAIPKM